MKKILKATVSLCLIGTLAATVTGCGNHNNSENDGKELLKEAILQLQRKEYGLQELEEQMLRVALVFSLEKRKFIEFSQCD